MLTLEIETACAEVRTKEVRSETREDQVRVYRPSGNFFGTSEGYAFQDEVRKWRRAESVGS